MKLSIIVVTCNSRGDLPECFNALRKSGPASEAQWIVVDNASTDGTVDWIHAFDPSILLIHSNTNLGFARANNAGLSHATGDFILFLNPDTIPLTGFPDEMISALERNPEAGAAGPRAYWDESKRFLISCLKTPTPLELWAIHSSFSRWVNPVALFRSHWELDWHYWSCGPDPIDTPAIGGAYLLMRRKALDSVEGGFDPSYFLGYEDVDLAMRLRRKGWRLLSVPTAEIVHFYGSSRRKNRAADARCRAWNEGPGVFLSAHYPLWAVRSAELALRIERGLKSILRSDQPDSLDTPVDSSRAPICLRWPNTGLEVWVEIATTPCFFDKFGVRTRESRLEFTAPLLEHLSPGRYYFRVIRTPPSPSGILHSGAFNV